MSELIVDMTRKEAEDLNAEIRSYEGKTRIGVYLMHARKGFAKLGYKSFDDYCESEIDTSRQTAYEWINQVQATCDALGISVTNLYDYHTNEKKVLLPTSATKELRKLPSSEQRREAWSQIEALQQHGMRTPREYVIGLQKIVKRMLKSDASAEQPAPSPQSQPAQTMPAPSAFDNAAETRNAPDLELSELIDAPPLETTSPRRIAEFDTPKTPSVKGFTPAPDPEPAEPFKLDFENAADVLNTCLTWVQNQEIDGDFKTMKWAIASLCEVSQWLESEL